MNDENSSESVDDPDVSTLQWLSVVDRACKYTLGVTVLVVLALVARVGSKYIPHVNALVLAVTIGIVIANTVGLPDSFKPGADTHKLWLKAGIVLMGARVSLSMLLNAGVELAVLVLAVVAGTILIVETLASSVFDIHRKLGSLLAAGAGVCGVSAAVGVAGSIHADENHLAYAAGTILLFDVVTLFVYPVVGGLLGLSDRVFGVWAGLTMFSTGPVTAAGFAFSETAGRWATVTKLTRNLLLGVLIGMYSIRYANADSDAFSPRSLWSTFPKFVLGFFAVVVLTSSTLVSDGFTTQLTQAYRWLFLLAFVGLGLSIDIDDLTDTGITPIALLFVTLVVVSVISLIAVRTLVGT